MAVTVRGTDILFNDGTTQSTAGTAYTPSYGAVGSLVAAASTSYMSSGGGTPASAGVTAAGSTLRVNTTMPISSAIIGSSSPNPNLSGTWVACNAFSRRQLGDYDSTPGAYSTLWMRIS